MQSERMKIFQTMQENLQVSCVLPLQASLQLVFLEDGVLDPVLPMLHRIKAQTF